MLAKKNFSLLVALSFAAGTVVSFVGCTPAGPRALLEGDAALATGKYETALVQLKRATELLPNEPRAWNLLGLAYHHSAQPQLAALAYKQALAKDRSNVVAVAHFNLGCLFLEQGNASAATDELRSFTLITNSAAGWLNLGTAQSRLRQFDNAERSFAAALRLEPKSAETLNALGTLNAQRNRTREAIQNFQAALQSNPKHRAALLNLAVVTQQNPATRAFALQQYREYLANAPHDAHWESVNLVTRQLETELAPPRLPALTTNAIAQQPPSAKTNVPVAVLKSNALALVAATVAPTNPVATPSARTVVVNPPPPKTNAPVKTNAVVTVPPSIPSNAPVTVIVVTNQPPPRPAIAEAVRTNVTLPPPPAATEVARATEPIADAPPAVSPSSEEKNPKRGFFTRLNPFRSKPKAPTNEIPRSVVLTSPANVPEENTPAPRPKPTFSRYTYLAPSAPSAGKRKEAQRAFDQGMKALRAGNTNQALLDYQLAMSADPSFVDAQHNYALVNLQLGEVNRALAAWESVLAIEPDSINARYNFALTLKKANYPLDAAVELERILEAKPKEVRAHLALGNLYAQELAETRRAREHYLKVIQLDPRNPEAATIRFWLAANP